MAAGIIAIVAPPLSEAPATEKTPDHMVAEAVVAAVMQMMTTMTGIRLLTGATEAMARNMAAVVAVAELQYTCRPNPPLGPAETGALVPALVVPGAL